MMGHIPESWKFLPSRGLALPGTPSPRSACYVQRMDWTPSCAIRIFALMRTTTRYMKVLYWGVAIAAILGGLITTVLMNRVHRHDELIIRISREYEVDPRLVAALIWKESKFDAAAVGGVGEIGLMQVTETVGQAWAAAYGNESFIREDLFLPEINIRAGTWYLARAIQQWSDRPDPLPYALAQYNAGRSNALRWARDDDRDPHRFVEQITFPTTREYVTDILTRYRGRV